METVKYNIQYNIMYNKNEENTGILSIRARDLSEETTWNTSIEKNHYCLSPDSLFTVFKSCIAEEKPGEFSIKFPEKVKSSDELVLEIQLHSNIQEHNKILFIRLEKENTPETELLDRRFRTLKKKYEDDLDNLRKEIPELVKKSVGDEITKKLNDIDENAKLERKKNEQDIQLLGNIVKKDIGKIKTAIKSVLYEKDIGCNNPPESMREMLKNVNITIEEIKKFNKSFAKSIFQILQDQQTTINENTNLLMKMKESLDIFAEFTNMVSENTGNDDEKNKLLETKQQIQTVIKKYEDFAEKIAGILSTVISDSPE